MGESNRSVKRWSRGVCEHGPVLAAQALVVCLLALLIGRLWYLQVPMGEYYRALAGANRGEAVSSDLEQRLDAVGQQDSDGAVLTAAAAGQPAPASYPHDETILARTSSVFGDGTAARPADE